MNKAKLADSLYHRVRLRPIPQRRMADGTVLAPMDDDWIVHAVELKGVRVHNIRTGHAPLLGFDHIHHYVSDPARDWDGLYHGFLDLNVQLTLSGCNVFVEPIRTRRRAHSRQ